MWRKESLSQVAWWNLLAAVVMTAGAFLTGYHASDHADQSFAIPDQQISRHHLFGRLLLFTVVPLLVLKACALRASYARRVFRGAYLTLLALVFALAVATSHLGGELVFTYGAGVAAKHPAIRSSEG